MTTRYDELTDRFEDLAIDPAAFGHIDHVGVAYVMLSRYDFMTASLKYARTIDTLATRAGAADKFNTTVTLAFLSIIAERMATTAHTDVDDFIGRNRDLVLGNPLKSLYSSKRLKSEEARRIFLLPDLVA